MRTSKAPRRAEAFIVTKEHRRFMEFANVVRKERYIGLCYGAAGVGKTQSARRYAHWQSVEPLLTRWGPRDEADKKVYATLARSRVLFFTPDVRANFGALRHQIDDLLGRINLCIDQHTGKTARTLPWDYVELVVLDEAERLNTAALEYLRDLFDRNDIGLILIGMPGIEKRMSRYPQLYSRVGFAHHYRPLLGDELSFVLARHWQKLGLELDGADFTDAQAVASIARITGGNFRLLRRLFLQIERVLRVNELTVITDDVVNAHEVHSSLASVSSEESPPHSSEDHTPRHSPRGHSGCVAQANVSARLLDREKSQHFRVANAYCDWLFSGNRFAQQT